MLDLVMVVFCELPWSNIVQNWHQILKPKTKFWVTIILNQFLLILQIYDQLKGVQQGHSPHL